jgi:hypothetical protein
MSDESLAKAVLDGYHDIAERKCSKEVALLRRLKVLRSVAQAAAQMELSLREMDECSASLEGWAAFLELRARLRGDRRAIFAKALEALEKEDGYS